MTKLAKAWIGLGAALIVYGGLGLSRYSNVLGVSSSDGVFWILIGVAWLLSGANQNRSGVSQKVMRGLSIGFAGAALALIIISAVRRSS